MVEPRQEQAKRAAQEPTVGETFAGTVAEISERTILFVREEIELAKAEVSEKLTQALRGLVKGLIGGFFLFLAIIFAMHGLAWGLFAALPFRDVYVSFLITAGLLVVIGLLLGFFAARMIKRSMPPAPTQAIEAAKSVTEQHLPKHQEADKQGATT